ncbi:hypothetical protein [Alistipes putredinis]|uniref:hypothetical protein n=1 Tax=Alistipes putredinis TaxID=28117 RepID=UPI003AB45B09
MKKTLSVIALSLLALGASAQQKGCFETHDLDGFKLHVYYTNDALGDASYIIEGRDALVTMEQPLFKDNVAEFDAYLSKLNKPVEQRITDYHVGGTAHHDVVMPEGMPAFTKGEIYGGMMQNFAQLFGDALTAMPTGKASEVAFDKTMTWAGVPFEFRHGASTDFPGASILIGGKVYYTHWTPAKAHVSHLQVSSPAAIDAEIAESEKSLKSGATLFIGGHGGAAKADAVQFKIDYLKTMKKLLAGNRTPEAFIDAMKKAYPNLPGADGLEELAKALYK